MVTIDVKNFLKSYYTNNDGDVLFNEICHLFDLDKKVELSFEGIPGLNSSFINSAFIQLLDKYSFDYIKENLTFVKSSKQINKLIVNRFKFEVNDRIYV